MNKHMFRFTLVALTAAIGNFFLLENAHADSALLTNPANGHQYQRFDTPILWAGARAICAQKGGHLATVTSEEENSWVWNNLAKLGENPRSMLGGADQRSEGVWQWITEEPWSYTNWDPGEPNNAGYGQDLLIYGNYNDSGWDDFGQPGEDGNYPYICEWDTPVTPFAAFTPRADMKFGPKANDDSFKLKGYIKLAGSSNGINPPDEPVTVKVGTFSATIPAGSSQPGGNGSFHFKGTIDKAKLDVTFWPLTAESASGTTIEPQSHHTGAAYWLRALVSCSNLDGTTIPPSATVAIGDDQGSATLDVGYAKFGKGKNGQNWVFPPVK